MSTKTALAQAAELKAWLAFDDAAMAWAASRTKEAGERLMDVAKKWAAANGYLQAVGGAPPVARKTGPVTGTDGKKLRSGQVVPFGRDKGVPIEEAETKSLQWLAGVVRESIADPSKERWAPKNRELLDAIEAELETR